jgi:hypothetical protein
VVLLDCFAPLATTIQVEPCIIKQKEIAANPFFTTPYRAILGITG